MQRVFIFHKDFEVNYCFLDSPRSRSYQTNRRTSQTGSSEGSRSSSCTPRSGSVNSFKEFLWQHVDLVLGRGFDDNVGRNPVQAIFEVIIFYEGHFMIWKVILILTYLHKSLSWPYKLNVQNLESSMLQ